MILQCPQPESRKRETFLLLSKWVTLKNLLIFDLYTETYRQLGPPPTKPLVDFYN